MFLVFDKVLRLLLVASASASASIFCLISSEIVARFSLTLSGAPETPVINGTNGGNQTPPDRVKENRATVSEEIRQKMDAEAVQIIFIGIDNDIYSTVDACPNAMEIRKAIKRLKQTPETPVINGTNGGNQTPPDRVKENRATVSEEIRQKMDAEAVQIIFIGIDNDIYSTVDACPNAMETRKAIKRLKQSKSIANSPPPTYDLEHEVVDDDEASSK
nr:hypothetical protein [Tanacetum cinerariifolium]